MKETMLNKILFWFKNLFRNNDEEYGPDYSEVRKIKPSRDNTVHKDSISYSSSNKKSSSSNKNISKSIDLSVNNYPPKDELLKQIKANIFFLEQLQELLIESKNYFSYQKKVLSMLKNSHNSHKIISRLRNDAPYYENTMEMIFRHTKSISTILEIST